MKQDFCIVLYLLCYSTVKPADIYSKCKGRFIPAFSKNALI